MKSIFPYSIINNEFEGFQAKYLALYILLRMSDGFRGPFLYPLYKSRGMSDHNINILFATTYLSSALFCIPAGYLADLKCKRGLIIVSCFIDAISCVLRLSSDYYILIIAHVLSGISYCILFPILESWMVEEHLSRGN